LANVVSKAMGTDSISAAAKNLAGFMDVLLCPLPYYNSVNLRNPALAGWRKTVSEYLHGSGRRSQAQAASSARNARI
jgi:hypothetical protein